MLQGLSIHHLKSVPQALQNVVDGKCEAHKVQQGQMQGPAPGSGQPPVPAQAGDEGMESSPVKKDLGMLEAERLDTTQPCAFGPQKPMVPWAVSPAPWAAGLGGICPSAPLW